VPVAGHYKVRLSYIATGMNWSADYVAHVLPAGHTLDLSGWLTLSNFGSTGFGRVPISAIAGRLNLTGEDAPVHPSPTYRSPGCWPMDIDWAMHDLLWKRLHGRMGGEVYSASPVTALSDHELETVVVTGSRIDPRQLGDYKLYPLPEPTDLPAHEMKQVQFLDLHDVPFERIYRYAPDDANADLAPAHTVLRLHNTVEGGLGKPLPDGNIAVSENGPDGTPVFVGQSHVGDTPVGLPVEVVIGETVSVQVLRNVVEDKRTGSGADARTTKTVDFEIRNNRTEAIAFELWQGLYNGETKIVAESRPHTEERGAAIWHIALKPGEHVTLHIGTETRS
jgi:hypothetical protein